MKLQIFTQVTISELNSILQLQFPSIKLVFFQSQENKRDYCQSCRAQESMQLGVVNPSMREGMLEVSGSVIVSALENYIYTHFRLNARVYRRFNRSWISAELASQLSLEMVNCLGEESHGAIQDFSLL